ncbi:glycine zipper 2TM domain-containing protein [uncultured Ramlibacter sp.]|uniref:glycine zipper 2TM domain-containing protein n=1 Tax=uncultured Ramlibacter sp. TaxID=260755 RepID=UPI002610E6A1|nr:glycine zipper 2TM domain-containing protein [uncultured Ramlibacter sp.]
MLLCSLAAVAALSAQAQEVGRVISSSPVIEQVAVPRQVCNQQPMVVQHPVSGAGSAIGAIAGGLIGSAIGSGGGRGAATVLGAIGGAVVGNQIEANGATQVYNGPQCAIQTSYENRTVAYNVSYEYNGRQYNVQMPQDPGPTVRLQISPVGATSTVQQGEFAAPGTQVHSTLPQAQQGAPVLQSSVSTVPGPVVYGVPAYPAAYPYPYYGGYRPFFPPIGMSLNFGYSRGWH